MAAGRNLLYRDTRALFEQTVACAREAVRLNPEYEGAYGVLDAASRELEKAESRD